MLHPLFQEGLFTFFQVSWNEVIAVLKLFKHTCSMPSVFSKSDFSWANRSRLAVMLPSSAILNFSAFFISSTSFWRLKEKNVRSASTRFLILTSLGQMKKTSAFRTLSFEISFVSRFFISNFWSELFQIGRIWKYLSTEIQCSWKLSRCSQGCHSCTDGG